MIESLKAAIKKDIDMIDDVEKLKFIQDFVRTCKRKNNLMCKRLTEERDKALRNHEQGGI